MAIKVEYGPNAALLALFANQAGLGNFAEKQQKQRLDEAKFMTDQQMQAARLQMQSQQMQEEAALRRYNAYADQMKYMTGLGHQAARDQFQAYNQAARDQFLVGQRQQEQQQMQLQREQAAEQEFQRQRFMEAEREQARRREVDYQLTAREKHFLDRIDSDIAAVRMDDSLNEQEKVAAIQQLMGKRYQIDPSQVYGKFEAKKPIAQSFEEETYREPNTGVVFSKDRSGAWRAVYEPPAPKETKDAGPTFKDFLAETDLITKRLTTKDVLGGEKKPDPEAVEADRARLEALFAKRRQSPGAPGAPHQAQAASPPPEVQQAVARFRQMGGIGGELAGNAVEQMVALKQQFGSVDQMPPQALEEYVKGLQAMLMSGSLSEEDMVKIERHMALARGRMARMSGGG